MTSRIARAAAVIALLGTTSMSRPVAAAPAANHDTLLRAIVLNMGSEGATAGDARYDGLFEGNSAASGVAAVIAAGRFSINGYPIPSTEAAFRRQAGSGYLVNQVPWLAYDAVKATWKGGFKAEKPVASYAAAAFATATGIVAGSEVRFHDTDGDGYADRIDADYKEGVIVGRIVRHGDGTYGVYRGDIGTAGKTPAEGRAFDGSHFAATSGERIAARNFDRSLHPQDVALFWYRPTGWTIQRAREVRGAYRGGTDHKNYDIGGTVYQDAMRFSRDNIPVSNRPGEYANAHGYFDPGTGDGRATVSLWLVPTTAGDAQGAPVALTSGTDARAYLTKVVVATEARLRNTAISTDGRDVAADRKWVSRDAHDALAATVARAKRVLQVGASDHAVFDYQVYLLYLSLAGSDGDIGAKFGGFRYAGFDRQVRSGLYPSARTGGNADR